MQAYYGPGVPLPPPYLSSPMMAGHLPPQMWGPTQGVMPPYGVPYQAVYPPGVVYAHPAIPLAATPASTEQPSKISDTADRGKTKKVKRLETISTPKPITNVGAEVDDGDSSWSQDQGFHVACDFSDAKAKDDRQLKREKRKQANRESARRSRMRKQTEVEELMERYESLKTESNELKFEINHLREESKKLRVENAALMQKLGVDEEATVPEEMRHDKYETSVALPNHSRDELLAVNSLSFSGKDESDALQKPNATNLLT